jgi:hypothetical protein
VDGLVICTMCVCACVCVDKYNCRIYVCRFCYVITFCFRESKPKNGDRSCSVLNFQTYDGKKAQEMTEFRQTN